jgi:hypothetical protein
MTERETIRLIAWSSELRRVHERLRSAVAAVRDAIHAAEDAAHANHPDGTARATATETAMRDLLVYCRGFCVALHQHHRGEDRALFPAIEAAHPELAPVLRNLEQDHSMIDFQLSALSRAVDEEAPVGDLERHLEGISAIMENHFAYEERQLLAVLETLRLDRDASAVLGDI